MPSPTNTPPPRSLDIYRLVVVRGFKQLQVANSFGISCPRVCQVVRRVRLWVNDSLGDWLFPGRDDLRFYVALESQQIRVHESDQPENVVLIGPSLRYSRQTTYTPSAHTENSPPSPSATSPDAHITAHLSPQPINSAINPAADIAPNILAATSTEEPTSIDPALAPLGLYIAKLLTVWKKNRNAISPVRMPRRSTRPTPYSTA